MKEQLNEKTLPKNFRRGDYISFTPLYDLHVGSVTNYASKFTYDIPVIEDSIPDICVWWRNSLEELHINYSLKDYYLNVFLHSQKIFS